MESKNHIELGNDLHLFFFDTYSPGSCFFLPHGAVIHRKLIERLRKYYKKNRYVEVVSPNLYDKKLWEKSGHWDKYKDNMFLINKTREEGMEFSLKPMNCPGHCVLFNRMNVSHKMLPVRMAEFGVLHRNEISGSLRGLTRVRRFQQDDAHIYCTLEQVESEIESLLEFIVGLYTDLNFECAIEVSTRPDNYIGKLNSWDIAEEILQKVVNNVTGKPPIINAGDGAFYGPKIDISLKDSLDRSHQCGTIQLDFNLPERFELKYVDADNTLQQPVMIHRALLGSLERFIAIVLEHTQGKLPLWMSPRQIMVLPIDPKIHGEYAKKVFDQLIDYEVELDDSSDDLRQKIKKAEIMKFNYILVIGNREIEKNTIAVRERDVKGLQVVSVDQFIKKLNI